MIERVGRTKYNVFAFDVESHNDAESVAKRETSIWLFSFINETSQWTDESSYGYTIDEFLDRCEKLSSQRRTNKVRPLNNLLIYIYNQSFEFSFFFPAMIKRGFKFKEKIEKNDEMTFNTITNKSCASVWIVNMKFHKWSGNVMIRDLSKLFPGGLGNVAKSFGLPTQKGEIDYTLNRLHGHVVTPEEKNYCFRDTRIIVDILLIMEKRADKEFWKSSSAATYSCRKMIKEGFPRSYRPMKAFRKFYPELDKEESDFLRNSVGGGITYAPTGWQFKNIDKPIIHIDAHQMHPTQAFKHAMPYGKGIYFKGQPPRDHIYISCCHIKLSYSGVKLHEVIKLIGLDLGEAEITVWSFEIPTILKCYIDAKITYIDGYAYRSKFLPWRQYYNDNYQKRKLAKKNHDAFNIMYYKLLNNSSYGKLLEHGHETILENFVNDNGIIDSKELPSSRANINASYTFLPVGSCIPAFSRVCLIETALKFGWKNIVYFDTDSIFAIKNEETLAALKSVNMKDELGGWGLENEIAKGQFSAPKRYKIEEIQEDGSQELVVHMAGINFKNMEMPSYEDIDIVKGDYDIQGIMRVKGGTIIVMKHKTIGVQKKYEGIYKQNVLSNNQ